MPETDPYSKYLVSAPSTPAPVESSDPYDKYRVGGSEVTPSPSPLPESSNFQPVSSDPYSKYLTSPAASPVSGQLEAPSVSEYKDPNRGLLARAWDWSETPTIDFGHLMSKEGAVGEAFGRTGEAGGIERGLENLASGLTSPQSIALTAATFGTGGLIESAGATALKEAATETGAKLFTDAEIGNVIKASQIARDTFKASPAIEPVIKQAIEAGGHDLGLLQKARELLAPFNRDADLAKDEVQSYLSKVGLNNKERIALEDGELTASERDAIAAKNGGFTDSQLKALAKTGETVEAAKKNFNPIRDAIKAAGLDPDKWEQAQSILHGNGMTEGDLLGGNLMERGTFQILRKVSPAVPIAVTQRAAETAKTLISAGFTLPMIETVAQMSPRTWDALKSGDTDKALEYGTEALAGTVFGLLGASHTLHSAGELIKPLTETEAFRPNDHWLAFDRANKEREAMQSVGEQHMREIAQKSREMLGHVEPNTLRDLFGESPEAKAQKNLELATVFHNVVTGGDRVKAAQWYNALAEALGREERLPEIGPGNGLPPTGAPLAPEEKPVKTNTRVELNNDAGEVRVGADGRPVVWLSPNAHAQFVTAVEPETEAMTGVSYSPDDLRFVSHSLSKSTQSLSPEIQALFNKAAELSPHGLGTEAASPRALGAEKAVKVVSEELHHTWQREFSQDGQIHTHLDGATLHPNGDITVEPGSQWDRLHGIIPSDWAKEQDERGYDSNPVVRVVETAAQFMSHRADGIIPLEDQVNFLDKYYAEVKAKHGDQAIKNMGDINEIARQHVEDINARTEAERAATERVAEQRPGTEPVSDVGKGRQRGAAGTPEEGKPEGLKSREISEDEVQHPIGFVSPNVHNLPNVQDAEFRLNSRPQKLIEKLSQDFAQALPGVRAVVRPAIGHWEGGAENSTIQRFAPGTDPDAVEYHNAFVTKAGYQNMGAGFIPGEGTDKLFQFRVPSSVADASQIGQVLEAHGIPGDTIEPVPGGYMVHVVSKGDTFRAQVSEIASRLDAQNIGETDGRAFQHGDYESRETAQNVLDSKLNDLESRHPNWRSLRQAFESRPDYVGLSKLVRDTKEPFVNAVHGTRAEGLETILPEKQFTGPQKGAEQARAKAFPKDYVPKSYWRVEGTHGEPFYERQPYQYKARFNAENLYPYVDDPERLLQASYEEAAKRGIAGQRGAIGTIYERLMKDAGYDGYYHPVGEVATFKDTPVDKQMRDGTSPLSGQPARGLAAKEPVGEKAKEFAKLSGLRIRAGMGDEGSAAIITGKDKVHIGPWHDDLMEDAGYKSDRDNSLYDSLYNDGGVKIRAGSKEVSFQFGKSDPKTVDRVYRAIKNSPDATKYHVEFSPNAGRESRFDASSFDKEGLLQKLKDWEEGRTYSSRVGSVSYFRSLYSRDWDHVKEYLTPEEQGKHNTEEKQNSLVAAFNSLPDADEWSAAVQAGRAGQMWYERSSRAFDALLDSGFDRLHPKDKEKFLNFVAALSPVQPVKTNLVMALEQWTKWDKAGRPTDVVWKDGKPNKSAKLYQMMRRGVDLQSRLGNAIRALQGEPLSGPKVSSFTKNLGEDVNRVTNDTWMAVLAGQDPGRINKPAIYDSMSAKIREAAETHGIAPRQAQAAAWSFIKSLAELSGWGKDRWIPPQEIVKQGLLTPELIAEHSSDFADLLQNDPKIRSLITKLGGDINAFDEKFKSYVPERPVQGEAPELSDRLLNAAGRLETARANAGIQRHLEAKSGPQGAFDFGRSTEFNPASMGSKYAPLYARENPVPQWYLKSNQIIDSRMQGPMPADTVQKMLENNGVKPDEMKYTGLDEFLRSKGKEPVRPEEVRDYLAANNLQVREVNHGDLTHGAPLTPAQVQEAISGNERGSIYGVDRDTGRVATEATTGMTTKALAKYLQDNTENFRTYRGPIEQAQPTKFGSYVLPGGENYREMLLTLPDNGLPNPEVEATIRKLQDDRRIAIERNSVIRRQLEQAPDEELFNTLKKNRQIIEDAESRIRAFGPRGAGADQFRSGHWDEPNVVGHVRFNDRTGPNGEKLLHLEELQSDWHQKGRTGGYKRSREEMQAASDALDASIKNREAEDRRTLSEATNGQYTRLHDVLGDKEALQKVRDYRAQDAAYQKALTDTREAQARHNAAQGGVPDAPFKKTWPELLMKRMVRYAAEHGYDGVSWTPGEDQAARYDLSKHIDTINHAKTPDGKYEVQARKDGRTVFSDQVSPEKLPDIVGKEVAQKIIGREGKDYGNTDQWKQLSGLDLKVGGEGMRGFYDKIVPELANKLGKQFGSKVGETKIEVPANALRDKSVYSGPEKTADELENLARQWDRGNEVSVQIPHQARSVANSLRSGNSFQRAMGLDGSQTLANLLGGKMELQGGGKQSVPYFPITDSMRESVLKQGQPLFARESPNNGLPSNIEDMIQNNKFKNQSKEYQDRVMESLKRVALGQLSDRELMASKYLADEQSKNFEIGSANGMLHGYIEDYMTRAYKDQNPEGRIVMSNSKQGKFSTNVTMARNRVYESNLAALLKSSQEMSLDPVDLTAQGRGQLIKAAANRQLIDKLRDSGTRGSDRRPAVVLSGRGNVVAGENGEDPKTFIDPARIRKINVADADVQNMEKTGDLQRFLENGSLKDITPYVYPTNAKAALERLEAQAQSKSAQYDEVGNNKLRTQIMYLKSMVENNDYSGLREFNDALPKKYAWDPQDYISLADNSMKGWNFVTNDSAGNGVLVRSDIRVHPEFAQYLKDRLGLEESGIAKNPIGKFALGTGSALKHTLLSLSPFHMVQIALRGIMTGVNPFTLEAPDLIHGAKVDPMDPNSPTKMYKMAEQGLTVGTDYKAQESFSEGTSSGGNVLRLVPGIGKTVANGLDWFQNFLFQRYIPAIKASAAEHMFDEYSRLHPEWSTDRVARVAAAHANDSFGGINWKAMGRNVTTQDWGRLMLLAPDWLESEIRSGARLFNKEEGGLGRTQVIRMAVGLWGIARVMNLLTTGNAHYEAPFGLAVKNKDGKETIFGIRTLPTDLLHAASDPVGFIKGRLSPTIRTGKELLTQRDEFGRKLAPSDMFVDIFRNMAPIPVQSIGQAVSGTGPEIGNPGQVAKALGGTAQVYRTPAQELASKLASNHNEDGVLDQNQLARHRQVMQLEDQLRSGAVTWPDLVKLTYQTDQLKESELKKIQENFKKTQGMPPDMASLYARAARLPAAEYLQLWDQMNPQEKASLAGLTVQVQKRYLNKAKKEMTPGERAKDPVFNRFIRMIPGNQQAAPGPQSQAAPAPVIPPAIQKEVAYLYTATHPQTGHRVASNDGQNWVDHQTGEPISA